MKLLLNQTPPARRGALLLAASLTFLIPGLPASAAMLVWDPLLSALGSDGAGPWDNTTANWAADGFDVLFPTSAQTTLSVALATGVTTITVVDTTGLAVGQVLSSDRFVGGTTITDITGNVVTLSTASTNTLAIGSVVHFSFNNDALIGSFLNPAGTITVSGNQSVDSLELNEADSGTYTLTGGGLTVSARNGSTGALRVRADTAISSALSWKNLQFQAEGKTLTLSGGSIPGAVNGTFNGSVSGSSAFVAQVSTLAVTGGTFTTAGSGNTFNIGDQTTDTGGFKFSGGTITSGGSFQVANERTAYAEISGTAVLNAFGQISIGRNSNANIGKFVLNGGTINATRAGGGNDTEVQIGRGNGVGIMNVESGTFNVSNAGIAGGVLVINSDGSTAGASGTLNLSGGTTTIEEIRFNGGNNHDVNATNGSGALNMTGGTLYIGGTVKLTHAVPTNGAGGIVNRNSARPADINLSGGTVGANASWSSSLNMTLGTTNGNVTFKAANAADLPFDISLSGILSGAGGIIKTGAGILTLSGADSYAGNTVVNAGTLVLGSINSNNEASTVTIAETGATLQLAFAGTDTVASLVIGANPPLANGVYGAIGSPAPVIGIPQITGAGTLTVGSVPTGSYSTWATANGISGESASGDFDHDGLTNFVEYALGLNPTVSSQSPGTFAGGVITFTKGADAIANNDVVFEIEESRDLGIADPWSTMVTEGPSDNTPDISYNLPTGQAREFARLKITQLP
ncbi:autotransporter-associated beta strand repeat-containing protein [Haloferula sp. BvORR071]|uniref:beta strand repeat-containing protein n=1 Tax=Haloferula sp. BvORR071 TaxID=1396141 RepID=UPI00055469DB|nr:autotransporter-associated beta strand repeat-containing protein [Haloferula sp. BvORR071]